MYGNHFFLKYSCDKLYEIEKEFLPTGLFAEFCYRYKSIINDKVLEMLNQSMEDFLAEKYGDKK